MAAASEASAGNSFDWGSFATGILSGGLGAYSDYNKTQQSYAQAKAEASKAEAAQSNYQSSLNFANMEKSKIAMIAIAVVGAIVGLFLIFRK